jgi:hypothetical protein
VLVEYGPGGYSPGHTHPKSAFIYATVLEGAIRSKVNNGRYSSSASSSSSSSGTRVRIRYDTNCPSSSSLS